MATTSRARPRPAPDNAPPPLYDITDIPAWVKRHGHGPTIKAMADRAPKLGARQRDLLARTMAQHMPRRSR